MPRQATAGSGIGWTAGSGAAAEAIIELASKGSWAGTILVSDDPTGSGTWGGGEQPASQSYGSLACPSVDLCVLSQL